MTTVSDIYKGFNSILSLQPLVVVLKKMVTEEKPGARRLYEGLLTEIEKVPELQKPIRDTAILLKHEALVESLLATIFPPSTSANEGTYAISFPFRSETVFASPNFKNRFLQEGSNVIMLPDRKTGIDISKASISLAFNVILNRFYSLPVSLLASSIYPFTDTDGLTRYYDLKLNAQFIDVRCINDKFAMPTSFSPQRTLNTEELIETFPLENFEFEGLMVIDVNDVTQDQVVNEIKNSLLDIDAFSDTTIYDKLQLHMQSLIGLNNVKIGVTPFFKMNGFYLYADIHYKNSLLFKNEDVIHKKDEISDLCQELFRTTDQPLLYQSLTENNIGPNKLLKYYYAIGARSLIICPLKRDNGHLIGLLEIMCQQPDRLQFHHLIRLQSALSLFTLALEKSNESLELQIDKTIKEHFTAVQPAVEWKFTEAAFNYLQHKQHSELVKMHSITFQNVYPLYGAIDVRNSSVERTNAIQLDIVEQLNMARSVVEKAAKIVVDFPLLKEILFKLDKYTGSASDTLLSDDELIIYSFLEHDIEALFRQLRRMKPELRKTIDDYFGALDAERNIIYHHRKQYEESITRINDVLDRFIDQEQAMAQQIFPHYFERYVTDGIEFNIYVGQSLAPRQKFDELYVRNLKIWQLSLLAKAARLSNSLEKKLSLPLQTTQLILAHSIPLSISFRNKERKFDVDGAYNIRYEIIKKRIDKVHTKENGERLTQPGKIAIVYSQQKELNEYLEFVEFLQHEKLLTDSIEHLELEDLQGISGLKALRIEVNLSQDNTPSKVQLSKVTSTHLLRK